jgi:hypothetical protein
MTGPMLVVLAALAALLLAGSPAGAAGEPEWAGRIRKDHPRLFFNAETWPAVKARALGPERAYYDRLKERVDGLPREPEVKDWGTEAASAAFVYRMTGDAAYLDLTKALLRRSIESYHATRAALQSVNWYSTSRINAWCAFDWIFDELTPQERGELGRSFLQHVDDEQPGPGKPRIERLNDGGPESGFYSTPSLLWYAGLATYGEGIDDARARDFLVRGHDLYQRLLEHRRAAAGDDGGSASATLGYCMGAYPWAELNFFHTWESATGEDISGDWPYVAYFSNYVIWNWLPGEHEFGTGDAYHTTNALPLGSMYTHLAETLHFYSKSQPECAALARWMMGAIPDGHYSRTWPILPFLLTRMDEAPAAKPPAETLPPARNFAAMGQVFMRSGSGPDDTYALFTSGGTLEMHRHYDNNNFVIYKKGFLALDTGTRPEPGQHLTHYYCRTVAHNCVLINKPGEELPRYWGSPAPGEEPLPIPNDGGQDEVTGSKLVAFETGPQYTYAAGDATPCYRAEKCSLALRQIVFIPPDYFVILDRVTSTRPEYGKTWLLHTAREPEVDGSMFRADQGEGRLFCRTLLPERAELRKIGGPGKQFWSDGRNWPLPAEWRTRDDEELLGQWRVEVSPSAPRTDDVFLHLIQVGDRNALEKMVPCELVREGGRVGVHFEAGERDVRVLFATAGGAAGHLRIAGPGGVLIDRDLTQEIMPQVGLLATAK